MRFSLSLSFTLNPIAITRAWVTTCLIRAIILNWLLLYCSCLNSRPYVLLTQYRWFDSCYCKSKLPNDIIFCRVYFTATWHPQHSARPPVCNGTIKQWNYTVCFNVHRISVRYGLTLPAQILSEVHLSLALSWLKIVAYLLYLFTGVTNTVQSELSST